MNTHRVTRVIAASVFAFMMAVIAYPDIAGAIRNNTEYYVQGNTVARKDCTDIYHADTLITKTQGANTNDTLVMFDTLNVTTAMKCTLDLSRYSAESIGIWFTYKSRGDSGAHSTPGTIKVRPLTGSTRDGTTGLQGTYWNEALSAEHSVTAGSTEATYWGAYFFLDRAATLERIVITATNNDAYVVDEPRVTVGGLDPAH